MSESNSNKSAKMIVRATTPNVLEYPFAEVDQAARVTPNELFFVRDHFDSPRIDARSWRLKVEGAIDRSMEFSFDDLRAMPRDTKQITIECAGNGRSLLNPKKEGLQWGIGAVGNANWTGVPLSAVLERIGVKPSAVELIFEGADEGTINKGSRPTGKMKYSRSVSIATAARGDLLLAYEMNGQPLPPEHGAPLRLIVPGWYGMACVKWLSRIIVTDRPFHGFFQTTEYARWTEMNGVATREPLTEMWPKAQIARPLGEEVVPAGKPYRVHGAAWSGGSTIAKVEITADGGATWSNAKLLDTPAVNSWQMWEWNWNVPNQPGSCSIAVRATDARGNTQPMQRDENLETYVISHVMPVNVMVK